MERNRWFKDSVFYQIYPRSFCDSNGDGIGDLVGIISKLDYLKDLGIDCIWLSPCYKSPNVDVGYDISDYYSINEEYGDMEDMQNLIDEIHKRGMKLIMDLVVNHTSDKHEWFQKSRDKDSPYRDYYVWKKGKANGKLPNNWNSAFMGPAWEYDEKSKEYYLHIFTKEQVDLNWENEKVRQEVLNILDFWFKKGVDGFRCDVINYISKPVDYPDTKDTMSPTRGDREYTNGPKIHEHLNFLNENAFGKEDKLFLGECPALTTEMAKLFTGEDRKELDMAFAFEHTHTSFFLRYLPLKFKFKKLKNCLSKWQRDLMNEGWNSVFLENHDLPRSISIYGDEKFYKESGKALISMLATLKGSLFIYEGQELGMTNHNFASLDEMIDTLTQSASKVAMKKFMLPKKFVYKSFNKTARDHSRTPMQWNKEKNGGFSTSDTTWMPVNPNYVTINAESESQDDNSILNYYKEMIKFRKEHKVITNGDFEEYCEKDKNFYIFKRSNENQSLMVVINYSNKDRKLPKGVIVNGEKIFGNYKQENETYSPYEVRIYKL